MPYFFILPIYLGLFFLFLMIGVVLLFIPRLRKFSGYILSGTVGTFPGFVLLNILFWIVLVGIAALIKVSVGDLLDHEVVGASLGLGLILFIVVGLSLANIIGCSGGFLAGMWIYRFIQKRRAGKTPETDGLKVDPQEPASLKKKRGN